LKNNIRRFDKLLTTEISALLIIDIQERILPVIHQHEMVVENTIKLIKGFRVLGLPIFHTEQYPKGLGSTVNAIKDELENNEAIQKLTFSCSGAVELFDELAKKKLSQVVVCGIESHVCVQQTVLDLLANEFQVNVAADAVASRKIKDYEIALSRMAKYGAEVTTSEAILFELLNVCGTDEFRKISQIVK
jgi:nicotinamidase-related amidase